jgi:hypothetical protein
MVDHMVMVRSTGRLEVLDRAGGVAREQDEQRLAPPAQAWTVGGPDDDAREEVGGVVEVERALQSLGLGEPECLGDIGLVLKAEARGDARDAVIGVAQVVDADTLGLRDVRHADWVRGDALVQHVVVFGPQEQARGPGGPELSFVLGRPLAGGPRLLVRDVPGEAVAHAGFGDQVHGMRRVGFELAAQAGHVDAEVVGLGLIARPQTS